MSNGPHTHLPSPPRFVDGLARYLSEIRNLPFLDSEEEYILAKRWHEHKDPKAAEKLVTAHLRLVAKVATGYRGYGLPMGDLIAEGNLGLMKALGKFDPDKGFRFSTYAMWWIRANMQEYILHSWSLVKIGTTAAQKKLFFNLRRLKNELQTIDQPILTSASIKEISHQLNVSEQEVVDMSKRLSGHDKSLNTPVQEEGADEWQDWLMDETENQEDSLLEKDEVVHKNAILATAINSLNEREQFIIRERRLKEPSATLETVAQDLGLSRERVRQLEIRAFNKLQQAVKEATMGEGE